MFKLALRQCLHLLFVVALAENTSGQEGAPLAKDEEVLWFPALATNNEKGWEVSFHGLISERENRPLVSWFARRFLGVSPGELTGDEREIFRERTRGFLADDEGRKKIAARVAGKRIDFGRTGGNGHFNETAEFGPGSFDPDRRRISLPVVTSVNNRMSSNVVNICLVGAEGISVVSDIDDTIKVSNVRNRDDLMLNTFIRPFVAVEGMASVYQNWAKISGATFHYVSGSPWQLFPALEEFTETNKFPNGSWHLRLVRLTRLSAREMLKAPDKHKKAAIEELLSRSPERRFVLVGDSGERDPEIYGEIARKHPKRMARIFIRDVSEEDASSERYKKAFKEILPEKWRLFREANELPQTLLD